MTILRRDGSVIVHSALDVRQDVAECASAGVSLEGADLSGANLSGLFLACVNLSGAMLNDANLSGANLMLASLKGASLRRSYLVGAVLASADLIGADCYSAHFGRAVLDHARFNCATLVSADLRRASLHDVDLRTADLTGASLDSYIEGESAAITEESGLLTLRGVTLPIEQWEKAFLEAPIPGATDVAGVPIASPAELFALYRLLRASKRQLQPQD